MRIERKFGHEKMKKTSEYFALPQSLQKVQDQLEKRIHYIDRRPENRKALQLAERKSKFERFLTASQQRLGKTSVENPSRTLEYSAFRWGEQNGCGSNPFGGESPNSRKSVWA